MLAPATILSTFPAASLAAWLDAEVIADLERVCEESDGELALRAIRDALLADEATLWLVQDASGHLGTVVEERRGDLLNLAAVRLRYTGALGIVLRFFGAIAAESGLRLVASSRRPGMGRLLKKYGWTPRFVEYVAPPVEALANRARLTDLDAPRAAGGDLALDALERAMLAGGEPVELPVVHRFTPGLYTREIFMPAGTLLTSRIHKTEHPFVVTKGRARVLIPGEGVQEIEAGHVGITRAGTRRLLLIVEDCTWLTFHPLADGERGPADLPAIEERIIERRELADGASAYELYAARLMAPLMDDYGGAP